MEPLREPSPDDGDPVLQGAPESGRPMQVNAVLVKDIRQPVDHPRRLHHEDDPFLPGPLLEVGEQAPKLARVLAFDPEVESLHRSRLLEQPVQIEGPMLIRPVFHHLFRQVQAIRRQREVPVGGALPTALVPLLPNPPVRVPKFLPVGQKQRGRRAAFFPDVVQQVMPRRDHQGKQRLETVEEFAVGGELEFLVQSLCESDFGPVIRSFTVPIGDVPGRDGQFSHGNHVTAGHQRHRPLRSGVERSNRFDLVSEELDAHGSRTGGREDIDDTAPDRVLAHGAHRVLPDVTRFVQGSGQVIQGKEPARLQVETLAQEGLGRGKPGRQGGQGRQDQTPVPAEDLPEGDGSSHRDLGVRREPAVGVRLGTGQKQDLIPALSGQEHPKILGHGFQIAIAGTQPEMEAGMFPIEGSQNQGRIGVVQALDPPISEGLFSQDLVQLRSGSSPPGRGRRSRVWKRIRSQDRSCSLSPAGVAGLPRERRISAAIPATHASSCPRSLPSAMILTTGSVPE